MTPPAPLYPVTIEQEAMWLHDRLYEGQSIYLESWACRLRGAVDSVAVEWAVRQIVSRHPALHSGIRPDGGRLVQVSRPDRSVEVERLRGQAATVDADLRELVRRPLDLRVAPVRVTLLRVGAGDLVLVWQFHHIVVDDWALSILEAEFKELYCARVAGRRPELPSLRSEPGQYAAAQRERGVDSRLVGYWREHLVGAPAESTVPPDRPPPRQPSHQGGLVTFRIDARQAGEVRALARRSRTTPFVVIAVAVAVLLRGCNGSADQVLATVVSRRGAADLDQMLTCLADLLPLRLLVRSGDSFAALIERAKRVVAEMVAHRDIPFSVLLRETLSGHDYSRPPLCQVGIVVDDIRRAEPDIPGVRTERLYIFSGVSKFDLEFSLARAGDHYQGSLIYASDLFDAETAKAIQAAFCLVLERTVARPDLPLDRALNSLPLGQIRSFS